ncbi:MAG: porin family protein [Bacteroidetes bacterium]|nr:MAG: porin family protein [Bacteroidota bacterium]
MKTIIRLVCIASFALFATNLAHAQKVTPRVGVNLSSIDRSLTDYDAEGRAGWNAGLDVRLGEGTFFLYPGLHYYSNTARIVDNINEDTRINFEEETTIQSLKAPLNIGLRLTGDNGLLGVYARGGFTPTYVLGVDETADFNFNVDQLNRFTWGANAGVGVDLLFLTAELNYEWGMTDYFEAVEGRNNVLTLSVGLKF